MPKKNPFGCTVAASTINWDRKGRRLTWCLGTLSLRQPPPSGWMGCPPGEWCQRCGRWCCPTRRSLSPECRQKGNLFHWAKTRIGFIEIQLQFTCKFLGVAWKAAESKPEARGQILDSSVKNTTPPLLSDFLFPPMYSGKEDKLFALASTKNNNFCFWLPLKSHPSQSCSFHRHSVLLLGERGHQGHPRATSKSTSWQEQEAPSKHSSFLLSAEVTDTCLSLHTEGANAKPPASVVLLSLPLSGKC